MEAIRNCPPGIRILGESLYNFVTDKKTHMKKIKFLLLLSNLALLGCAQKSGQSFIPDSWFYAGESPVQRMYILRNGQVSWDYVNPDGRGEISDAVLQDDGNILIAHQYGIAEIAPDKSTVWKYPAPDNTEIHTIQPIGKDKVVFVQNDIPCGKVIVMRKKDHAVLKEFPLPVRQPASVHGQFRCARLTADGTYVVANMGLGMVCEYNADGNELKRIDLPGAWGVEILENGNWLLTSNRCIVREYTPDGQEVWSIDLNEHPDYGVTSTQKSYRLPDGCTLIGNWLNEWNKEEREARDADPTHAPPQFIAVNPAGEKVWELRSWEDPDLGPSTTWQSLDKPVVRENMFFGPFK